MTCISNIPRTRLRTLIRLPRRLGSGGYAALADRQERTLLSLTFNIFHIIYTLLVLLTPFSSYHGVLQTTTFACRPQHKAYSCRRISNGSAHGPSMHEFTSPFYSIAYSSFGPFSQMSSEECTNVLCLKIAVLAAHLY